jgi:hypothetical protein
MTKQRTADKRQDIPTPDRAADWPGWVPVATRNYLAHVEGGQTIRELAKAAEVSPSTVLRRVRKIGMLRDDPLLDAALRRMVGQEVAEAEGPARAPDAIRRDAIPVLRELADLSAVLAIATDMDKAVVAREGRTGQPERLAVCDRALAEEMALRGWIACQTPEARVRRYRIAAKGKALLKEHAAALRGTAVALRRPGFDEAPAVFALPPCNPEEPEDDRLHHMRSALGDTPLVALSRRRDDRGEPFLTREHLATGDRLREDFELARREEDGLEDWQGFLEHLAVVVELPGTSPSRGAPTAGDRLRRALLDLGPGMADVALRCCCLLEGIEGVERQLGWSARSGKIVLRIALGRLDQHYRTEDARLEPLIG